MVKGKGNGKSGNFWRNKIKKERKQPNAKFRSRERSKGKTGTRLKSNPSSKGQRWASQIKKEARRPTKIQIKKAPRLAVKSAVKGIKANRTFKARQSPSVKPAIRRRPTKLKNKIISVKRDSNPTSAKKIQNLKKTAPAVAKTTRQDNRPSVSNKGISKLKSSTPKAKPVQAPAQTKKTSVKGVSLIKAGASKIAPPAKNVKRVKQPVIRRGR